MFGLPTTDCFSEICEWGESHPLKPNMLVYQLPLDVSLQYRQMSYSDTKMPDN